MTKYGLTKARLDAEIKQVDYATFGATGTHCAITLHNGYVVTGESACIDPEQFNYEIGKKIAYEQAFEKLWMILGYNEKQRWYEETKLPLKDIIELELKALDAKRANLKVFLEHPKPFFVPTEEWELLQKQAGVMNEYALILQDRIALLNKLTGNIHRGE